MIIYNSEARHPSHCSLVHTLERRNGLALGLIKRMTNNTAVTQLDLAVRLLLIGQSVLHPVVIVAVRIVLTGMSTTGLLSVGS